VRPIVARVLPAAAVLVALAGAGLICAAAVSARSAQGAAVSAARPAGAVARPAGAVRHVVLIGVPGLRWASVSAAATPALWRLARQGSVGSLSVTGARTPGCPADGWLMLNAGARAAAPRTATGSCAPLPEVTEVRYLGGTAGGTTLIRTQIGQMPSIVSANQAYNENPA
jgi:hypothetical protein